MKDILILRGGGLGDTLLALPAVRALRRRFSPCRMQWVGNPQFLPVVPMGIRVERLRSADGPELAILRRQDVDEEDILTAFSREAPFDVLVAWTQGDSAFEKGLRALAREVLRADPHPPGKSPPLHAVDYLLQSLEPLGVEGPMGEERAPEIRPTSENIGDARIMIGRLGLENNASYFVLHPGSGGRWKCWPPSCFVKLAENLSTQGEIVWAAGSAEEAVLEEVRDLSRGRSLKIVSSAPLPVLAGLLRGATGYVGNDSGVTHLAAACGAPTVALFGPTDPAVWGARGAHVVTFRRNAGCESCKRGVKTGHTCLAAIEMDEVREALLGLESM
ncbi:MAG: glycosyltransferase family 9 protein [Nitrospinota bacterium]